MDARERLRRYLEQRREMGERELVLDDLSVEDVMRILGASDGASSGSDPAARREPPRNEPPRDEPRRESRPGAEEHAPPEPPPAGYPDWREVLRSAGGSPPPRATPSEKPAAPKPPPPEPGAGLVVGASGAELFAGPFGDVPTLDELASIIAKCTRCPLYSTALNPVPGEGNPNAELVCVGEAPGENEDKTGRPFVGAAGQLLTKILAAINLRREDVFICNVLKHRPPANRNPMPLEVTACSPYLVRQLELIRPKVIVAFGTFAAQTLLDTKLAIGKLRGTVHRYHGIPLVVTYHPAALLRNPAWKRPTWEDVKLARRVLDSATGT